MFTNHLAHELDFLGTVGDNHIFSCGSHNIERAELNSTAMTFLNVVLGVLEVIFRSCPESLEGLVIFVEYGDGLISLVDNNHGFYSSRNS